MSARRGAAERTTSTPAPLVPKREEPHGPGETGPHDGDTTHTPPSGHLLVRTLVPARPTWAVCKCRPTERYVL